MTVDIAVIPVAGMGTRMLPASKSIPKEMLPVVDRPVIEYVVREAVRAGFRRVVLVTHSSKTAIEDYFDTNAELEQMLRDKGKEYLLEQVQAPDIELIAVRQHRALGLGHAVSCAAPVVNGEPFAVLLPDVLLDCDGGQEDLAQMRQRYEETGAGQILVEPVPPERVDQYGIVALQGEAPTRGEFATMTAVVEKPSQQDAPSQLAVVGRYLLPGEIMDILKHTEPGAGNEIQLTDAIATLLHTQRVEAYSMTGATFDCGHKAGYMKAILHYALKHPELGEETRTMLNEMKG